MAGARRKIKRMKRTVQEDQDVLEKLMATCRRYGMKVDFSWQLPDIFERALSGGTVSPSFAAPTTGQQGRFPAAQPAHGHRAPDDALRQLSAALSAGLSTPRAGVVVPQQTRAGVVVPQHTHLPQETEEDEVDMSLLSGLYEEFGEPGDLDEPPDMQTMIEAAQAGQARMMGRVAQHGVRVRGGGDPNPAAGRKLVPHPSTPKKILGAKAPIPRPRPDEDPFEGVPTEFNGFDMDGEGDDGTQFGGFGGSGDASHEVSADDSRIDEKTGMSIGQKRDLMSRVLGREVKPPGAPGTGVKPGEQVPPVALQGPSAMRR